MSIRPTHFVRFMLLAFLSIMVLMFAGCRSKKSTVDKKQETVSELKQNDIKTSEKATLQTATYKISSSQTFSVEPVNNNRPVRVINGGDTLSFSNAKINFSNTNTTEDTAHNLVTENTSNDNSSEESTSQSSELNKSKKIKSASWGLNLGIVLGIIVLLILGYIHFQKPV